jgi:hypothetical protein
MEAFFLSLIYDMKIKNKIIKTKTTFSITISSCIVYKQFNFYNMKKTFLVLGILAATIIAVVVFDFCTKQTETVNYHSANSVKVRKGTLLPCNYAQRYTSPIIPLGSSGYSIYVEIVCCNCLIDGDCYIIDGSGNVITGTYHAAYLNGNWVLSPPPCNGSCLPSLPSGVSYNDLLAILTDPWFTPCCGSSTGGGGGPCSPIRPVITLPSGICVTVEIECCNGTIGGWFEEVDCNTGNTLWKGDFCATYQGPSDNPNEFNNPDNWSWCGSSNAPSDILETLRNTWLVPCL